MFSYQYCEIFKTPLSVNGCFFKHSLNEVTFLQIPRRVTFLGNYFWYYPYHFLSLFVKMSFLYSIVSYVSIVTLFVKQNILILYCLKVTPRVTKTSHMWKNYLIYLVIFILSFLEVSYERICVTKGAAHATVLRNFAQFWKHSQLYYIANDFFVSSILLKNQPCCQFMFQYDIEN